MHRCSEQLSCEEPQKSLNEGLNKPLGTATHQGPHLARQRNWNRRPPALQRCESEAHSAETILGVSILGAVAAAASAAPDSPAMVRGTTATKCAVPLGPSAGRPVY